MGTSEQLSRKALTQGLDPELRDYVSNGPLGLEVLHPLLRQGLFMHEHVGTANKIFRGKKTLVAKAHAERDWETYLVLHEKPYRAQALAWIEPELTDQEFSAALADAYTSVEFPFRDPTMRKLLKSPRIDRQSLMTEEEHRWFERLPQELVIYRGVSDPKYAKGFSWTLSLRTAFWFASRFRDTGQVLRGVCWAKDVMAVLLARGEAEVLIRPAHVRQIVEYRELDRPKWLADLWSRCVHEYRSNSRTDSYHGPAHWAAVESNVIAIGARVPGCDVDVGRAFAALHDCRRENEDCDPEHGARAARLAMALRREGLLPFTRDQMNALVDACAHHTHSRTSSDPTVGACWDSDRLDLARVGILPERQFFTHQASFDLLFKV